jgi:hypothetical protein
MPRKSLALFLATTGLITSLAACGGGQDAKESGGDDSKAGQTASPANGPKNKDDDGDHSDTGDKHDNGKKGDKRDEGGEGGEGGEG